MELIEHTSNWSKGDLLQGRIMLTLGILILIAGILILRSNHEILRGTLIPLSFILIMFIGYGGFLAFTRNGHFENVKSLYERDKEKAIVQEYTKAKKDHEAYSKLKPIWIALIIISAISFYFFKTDYLKGLSIGLISFFLIALIVDSTLHYRLKPYYQELSVILPANRTTH